MCRRSVYAAWSVLIPETERYSRKVQQPVRTRGAWHGRGRTVTCGDGRGWTCCRQMACKRSGVRISLAPLVGSEIRIERTASTAASTAAAARRAAVRVFGSVSSAGARCWKDRGFQSPLRCLSGMPPGQTSLLRRFDTCRLDRVQARASGQSGCDRCRNCRWSQCCGSGTQFWSRR